MRFLREGQTLSKVEKIKLERHPLEVRQAIIDTYSKDLAAMSEVPGEVERLKWVGIYPQKQGGDAFMMRIKVPGGILTPPQARVIGRIATDFANGPIPNPHFGNNFLDLTTRQDVQMHWIKMGDIPEIWRRLEEVDITTVQACGDSARNVLCCPVSGLGEEAIDAYPVAQAISDYFTGNREYAVEITRGIAQVFGELGNRENRWMARMRYLVQELGPEGFREEFEKRVSVELTPAGEDLTKRYRGDHVGVHPQKQEGLYYVGLNVPVGRMSGEQFEEAGTLAEEYG